MSIIVINHTGTIKHVPIVGPHREVDEIHLQPKGKVTLAYGWSVNPTYREKGIEARDPNARVSTPPRPSN